MLPAERSPAGGENASHPLPTLEEPRFVESISPVGFKKYFEELAQLVHDEDGDPDGESSIAKLGVRYGLTFYIELVPDLLKRHGLTLE